MARVVILPDAPNLRQGVPTNAALIEEVHPDHLDDEPSAIQTLQRIEWAIREVHKRAAFSRPARQLRPRALRRS